jgi:GNAT superfamily N-acetyltransferase
MIEVRRLEVLETRRYVTDLADCVAGGASVSFMPPFGQADAEAFFRKIADSVETGERILLAAFDEERLVGTVQIITALPPNQPHRADIAKLLVHRAARGLGGARRLMEEAERTAAAAGKTLLVLDTATGDTAERLYERMDWVKVGVIPKYALYPDGRWTGTTIFYKELAPVTVGGK